MSGPAHPSWIDGRHSKVLPKRLLAGFQESLSDPDQLALEAELAVVDARIGDVLQRVDSGESGQLWQQLAQEWEHYEKAHRINNTMAMDAALAEMGDLITSGDSDRAAWADVLDLIHRRTKLVETERKRLVAAQQFIAADQALAMMGLLVDVVQHHVTDPTALRAITGEYSRLVGRPDPGQDPDC